MDTASGRVTFEGRAVELTALELKMLTYFLHRVGRIVTQGELTEHLYPLEQTRESNTIEVYVSRLRRKFGSRLIKTLRGLGISNGVKSGAMIGLRQRLVAGFDRVDRDRRGPARHYCVCRVSKPRDAPIL